MATDRLLLLRLSTSDANLQRQLLHDGLSVWFDATGGEKKVFGLRFPMGRQMMPPAQPGERDPRVGIEQMVGMQEEAQEQVEILCPSSGTTTQIISLAEAYNLGIELRMVVSKGLLVYEMKVPLVGKGTGYPFVVAPQGTKNIGVGYAAGETAEGNRPAGRGPGGFGSGGGGGPGGDFPGGGGRMPPSGGKRPEPFELWTKVSLALSPPDR
ncbi:MAG: hypothetical protein KKC76_21355 [Proteobacteria bacterium]|nr:hypothetical protein [Pseudomonadota bacterium]MBU4296500.1 hypothetical protein [Pseudomonadota bacterium]MCG2745977.1 hypothetical protein [Desulfobulbaceae bacterium]